MTENLPSNGKCDCTFVVLLVESLQSHFGEFRHMLLNATITQYATD